MTLSDVAIRRPVFTTMVSVAIVVLGFWIVPIGLLAPAPVAGSVLQILPTLCTF